LHRTLGTGFFQQNRKNIFADGFCPGPSAQDFFSKKIEKPSLPTASAQGSWHRIFKKNKIPLFAEGPVSWPSAKKFSKTVIQTPR
jgi:hypothetical protein